MNTNRIKIVAAAVWAVLSLAVTSCGSDYLDRLPQHEYTEETFYNSEDIDESAMLRMLEPLYNKAWHDYNQRAIIGIGSFRANDGWSPYLNGEFARFQITGLTTELAQAWSAFYNVVVTANSIINSMDRNAKEGSNAALLNQINGEARLMRGLAYFYLLRGWGEVILFEDNDDAAAHPALPLNTEESVLKFVIRDFEKASELLPETSTTANHPSKYVAKALLAKALLAQSGWKKSSRDEATLRRVVDLCTEVINCGQYQLLDDYEDLFKVENNACYVDNNKETLLALRWADPLTGVWGEMNTQISDLAWSDVCDVGVWGGSLHASVDMIELYNQEPKDSFRLRGTFFSPGRTYDYILEDKYAGGYTYDKNWMQIKKGVIGDKADCNGHLAQQASPYNTYLLRLADVYLTKAEAMLGNQESTSDGEALAAFNATRIRAKLEPKSSFTFEDLIRERRIEFCMEYVNWFDMVTWYRWKPQFMLNYFNNRQYRGFMMNDGDVYLNEDKTLSYRVVPPGNDMWYFATSYNEEDGSVKTSKWSDAERYNDGTVVRRNDAGDIVLTGGTPQDKAHGYTFDLWKESRATDGFLPIVLSEENIFMPYPEADVLQNPYFNQPAQEYDFGEE